MGAEVMRMAKVMKVGLTIQVSAPLRALFRGASGAVDVWAWASRQALDKAERWGWDLEPTHLSFTTGVAPTLAFGEGGAATLAPDDVPLPKPLTIQGLALEVIRHFLAEMEGEGITLHLGPSSLGLMNHYLGDAPFPEELELTVTAYDGRDGYTRLKMTSDGAASVKEAWGSEDYWDAWLISPDGQVEYIGSVNGPRYLPLWLSRALEEAKAKA
jgi:hypothetical protein